MRRALGKGLEALFPSADGPDRGTGQRGPIAGERWLRVEEIRANPRQPRRTFDGESLDKLAQSIRERGLLQPVVVRPSEGGYELIAGERRLRAAVLAGLERVPAIVREASDRETLELALIENLQRRDLSPLEEAEAFRCLIDDYGLSQDEVARRVGRSRPAITNALRLLSLPEEVRAQVDRGALSAGHARALLALDSAAAQTRLAREIIARGMSVREAERAAAARRPPGPQRRHGGRRSQVDDPDVRAVEEELAHALGTRVRLRRGPRGGTIEIQFYSHAELERLVNRLCAGRGRGGTRFDNAASRVI